MLAVLGLRSSRVLWSLGILTLIAEGLATTGILPRPTAVLLDQALSNPFIATSFGAAFLVHMFSSPRPKEVAWTLGSALVVGGGLSLQAGVLDDAAPMIQVVLVSLGLSSLMILAARSLWTRGPQRAQTSETFSIGILMVAVIPPALSFLHLTGILFPRTLDPLLFAADLAFPGPVPVAAKQLLDSHRWLRDAVSVIYASFPLALVFVYALERRLQPPPPVGVLPMFLATVVVGYSLYLLFPVAGPIYAFEAMFHGLEPAVDRLTTPWLPVVPVPRNCWPSLHTSWALLVWWHSRPFKPPVRILAAVFLVGTLLATIGLGLHYVVDLIVAYPFTLAVRSARLRLAGLDSPALRRSLVASACFVVGWFVFLRVVVPRWPGAHAGVWAFSAVTLMVTGWLRWMTRDEERVATTRVEPQEPILPWAVSVGAWLLAMAAAIVAAALAIRIRAALPTGTPIEAALASWIVGVVAGLITDPPGQGRWTARALRTALGGMALWFGGVAAALILGPTACVPSIWAIGIQVVIHLGTGFLVGVALGRLDGFGFPRAILWSRISLGAATGVMASGWVLLPALGAMASAAVALAIALLSVLILRQQTRASRVPRTARALCEPMTALPAVGPASPIETAAGLAGTAIASAGLGMVLHALDLHIGGGIYAPFRAGLSVAAGAALGLVLAPLLTRVFPGRAWRPVAALLAPVAALGWGTDLLAGVPAWLESLAESGLPRVFGVREVARGAASLAIVAPLAAAGSASLAFGWSGCRGRGRVAAMGMLLVGPLVSAFITLGPSSSPMAGKILGVASRPLAPTLANAVLRDAPIHARTLVAGLDEAALAAFRDANVTTLDDATDDLRTPLACGDEPFDLVMVDLARIEAVRGRPIATREALLLVRDRLGPQGLLALAFPLDRLSTVDVLSLLATLRVTFPVVFLRAEGHQAVAVACSACEPSRDPPPLLPPEATDLLLSQGPNRIGLDEAEPFSDDRPGLSFALPRDEGGHHQTRKDLEWIQRVAPAPNAQ